MIPLSKIDLKVFFTLVACATELPHHLPKWRELVEQTFVHGGSWMSIKGLDKTQLATVDCHCQSDSHWCHWHDHDVMSWCHCQSDGWHFDSSVEGYVICKNMFNFEMPRCTKACSSSTHHSSRCRCGKSGTSHCYPKWHNFPVYLMKKAKR